MWDEFVVLGRRQASGKHKQRVDANAENENSRSLLQRDQPDFPDRPERVFNYTQVSLERNESHPQYATAVYMLDYNASVEIMFQGTILGEGIDHPSIYMASASTSSALDSKTLTDPGTALT
ncbi:hypothetical protein SASPL_113352 [Salvia splendens]|uniref:Uncharacterized protein n=1 Tax=Salvia splendens TaxID=180675 RepID=A0A8X9A0Z4_SALSN|nr:hypothetical protein SASPL_113352 [Salvia splendens]